MNGREIMVFDFAVPGVAVSWRSVNDTVMGGLSSSAVLYEPEGFLAFAGIVSLAQGGGFASIRSQVADFNLSGATELRLLARGDGKVYKLTLRTDTSFDGIAFQAAFVAPPGPWLQIPLALAAFRPTYHGRLLPDVPPPDPALIRRFGLVIAGRQEGPFRLELRSITALMPISRHPA